MPPTDETEMTDATALPTMMAPVVSAPRRLGMFAGVFTPTFLSIVGVLLYLRVGWVVGNAGLGETLIMLAVAAMIAICTGWSYATLASNTRVNDGDTFAVLNQGLGFEVAGTLGIPLALSRPLLIAMHIFGFRAGLIYLEGSLQEFALYVDIGIFVLFFILAYRLRRLPSALQYGLLALIVASVVSIVYGQVPEDAAPYELNWWGSYPPSSLSADQSLTFWPVFAILFPALTGFLAETPTSGGLKEPRRDIPNGTMLAIVMAALVYGGVAVWCATTGTIEVLVSDPLHVIHQAWSPPLVAAGLLGATATSALAGLTSAPRILQGLGNDRIVPFSDALSETIDGKPRNALLVTAIATFLCLLLRDLNVVASMATLFILVAYAALNAAVIVEQGLSLISFRPTFNPPRLAPFIGLSGSLAALVLISPLFGMASVIGMFGTLLIVRRRGQPHGAVPRSTLFLGIAEWAASKVTGDDASNPKAWRPNFVVPVVDAEHLRDSFRLLMELARPEGSIRFMGIATQQPIENLGRRLGRLSTSMKERSVRATWSTIDMDDFERAVHVGTLAFQGAFLRPNVMFLRLGQERARRREAQQALQVATQLRLGVALYLPHPDQRSADDEEERSIRLWIRRGPRGWDPHSAFNDTNLDLPLLLAMRLQRLWNGPLELATFARSEADQVEAAAFLESVRDMARLPRGTEIQVFEGQESEGLTAAPTVDLTIVGFKAKPELQWAESTMWTARGSCLFVLDSGRETALA
ncbi:MAG: hypothetical protein AAGA48_06850 [Myxococcota bacterium]